MCQLHHVAIAIAEFEKYKELFEKLGMKVQRTTGEIPFRQLWFYEGIQLKEVCEVEVGNHVDHIAFDVQNIEETVKIALENGCSSHPRGDNWFILPNGTIIELMEK